MLNNFLTRLVAINVHSIELYFIILDPVYLTGPVNFYNLQLSESPKKRFLDTIFSG